LFELKRYKQAWYCTFIESIGCSREVESALARPPAKADFKTLPVDISIGGGTATTVAASNQMFLNAFVSEEKVRWKREHHIMLKDSQNW